MLYRQFFESLLYCCRASIQDLNVSYILPDYERDRTHVYWKRDTGKLPPGDEVHRLYQTLSARPSFDQLGPFALKKVLIHSNSDEAFVDWSALLRCCPNIADVGIPIVPGNIVDVVTTLGSIRTLTGLDLTNSYHEMDIFAILSYISQLQRISLPYISSYETLGQILDKLYLTSGQSLQVFHCTHVYSGAILRALQSFRSLKELHTSQTEVNLTWLLRSPKWACHESLEVLVIDEVLYPEWALPPAYSWGHIDVSGLPNWKENSKRAKEYLADVSRLYTRRSEQPRLRTIALQCEYVFRPFFAPEKALKYANTYGSDANSRRSMTLKDISKFDIDRRLDIVFPESGVSFGSVLLERRG